MVTIKQLQRELAIERKKFAKRQEKGSEELEKIKLKKEIRSLKFKSQIDTGAKAKRLIVKGGKALLRAGKKAAPVIQKQARLIREQQLRDDALERIRTKQAKKTKRKVKVRKTRKEGTQELSIFEPLDF